MPGSTEPIRRRRGDVSTTGPAVGQQKRRRTIQEIEEVLQKSNSFHSESSRNTPGQLTSSETRFSSLHGVVSRRRIGDQLLRRALHVARLLSRDGSARGGLRVDLAGQRDVLARRDRLPAVLQHLPERAVRAPSHRLEDLLLHVIQMLHDVSRQVLSSDKHFNDLVSRVSTQTSL